MSRVQLALNVRDLDAAVEFYRALFRSEPAKRRPGYANFAIADPPLKLVLFEAPGAAERLNHLGIEVSTAEEVGEARARLTAGGVDCGAEETVECCYAVQDKVWVEGPDGASWEIYRVLGDSQRPDDRPGAEAACCAS